MHPFHSLSPHIYIHPPTCTYIHVQFPIWPQQDQFSDKTHKQQFTSMTHKRECRLWGSPDSTLYLCVECIAIVSYNNCRTTCYEILLCSVLSPGDLLNSVTQFQTSNMTKHHRHISGYLPAFIIQTYVPELCKSYGFKECSITAKDNQFSSENVTRTHILKY